MTAADQLERLDQALDALLALRVALGGTECLPVPADALDEALGQHEGFQAARRAFAAELEAVGRAGLPAKVVFALEAAAHHLAGQAGEVGWSLGVTGRGSLSA